MAETLSTLSIISFAVAGVCFAIAVFFFFFFKIPTVIGDLSGKTARKSIAKMRAANEKTGNKSYKESKTNLNRGKVTDTMHNFGKTSKKVSANNGTNPETGLLNENKAVKNVSEETALLDDEATGFLDDETTGLLVDADATAPLDNQVQSVSKRTGGKKLVMIDEVMLVHTDEVIE